MSQAPASSTFPLLNVGPIVDVCKDWGLVLNEEDIAAPTPAKVQSIYEWWMAAVLSLNAEDCTRAAEAQLDHMDDADYYREALTMGTFETAFNQLMVRASIDDFSGRDLTAPTSIRVRRILSGLINFYLYEREQAAEVFDPAQEEQAKLDAEYLQLLEEEDRIDEEIAELQAQRAENQVKVETGIKTNSRMKEALKQKKTDASRLQGESETVREELKTMHTKMTALSQAQRSREMEVIRLRGRIIQSPERIRTNLTEMTAAVIRERESIVSLEKKEREMSSKVTSMTKYQGDLAQCIKILDEWEIDQAKAAETLNRFDAHMELSENLKTEQAEYEDKLAVTNRRITNFRDELARFQEKTDKKRVGSKLRIKTLTEAHSTLHEQRRGLELDASSKNKEVAELENEIRAINARVHSEFQKANAAYKKLMDTVSTYSIKMNKALDAVNTHNAEPLDLA